MKPFPFLLFSGFIFLLASLASAEMKPLTPAADGSLKYGACHARLKGDLLTVGNSEVERVWRVNPYGSLAAVSFRDLKSGREWIKSERDEGARATAAEQKANFALRATAGQAHPGEAPSLMAILTVRQNVWIIETRFQVFAEARGILMCRQAQRAPETAKRIKEPEGLTCDDLNEMEAFTPSPRRWTLGRARVVAQPGTHGEPRVLEARGEAALPGSGSGGVADIMRDEKGPEGATEFQGNLFFIEDRKTSDGLVFLKLAPPVENRTIPAGYDRANLFDFSWERSGRISLSGIGIEQGGGETCRWVALAYRGGREGRIAALRDYHRQQGHDDPLLDGVLPPAPGGAGPAAHGS